MGSNVRKLFKPKNPLKYEFIDRQSLNKYVVSSYAIPISGNRGIKVWPIVFHLSETSENNVLQFVLKGVASNYDSCIDYHAFLYK